MRCVWSSWAILAVAGALAGCGGGGGGGSASGGSGGTAATPVPATYLRTGPPDYAAEAARDYGLAAIGATTAQAANQNGAGITVGVIDTGIDLSHPDFAGAISSSSTNILTGSYADTQGIGTHGTMVAGIIGARKDGYDVVGVAPQSTLLAIRSDTPGSCPAACSFDDSNLASAVNYAVAHGAKIINLSLGGASISSDFQTALANATGHGVIVVAAAGNTGGTQPINPALSLAGATGNGIGLAVGAVDQNNQIAWFSNQAGATASHFLVAPGVNITSDALGGGVVTGSGTSFAAPMVSGAAAAVWGASPFLTAQQVVDLLLSTATSLGSSSVYGRGLVNLPGALQPVGGLSVQTGGTVNQGGAPLQGTQLTAGAAFGDALALRAAPKLAHAVTFDAYGRPFLTDLSGHVQGTPLPLRAASDWLHVSGATTTTRIGPASLTLTSPPPPPPDAIHSVPGQPAAGQPSFALATDLGGGTRVAVTRGLGLGLLTGLAASTPEAAGPGITGDAIGSPYLDLAGGGMALATGRDLGAGLHITLGLSQDGGPLSVPADPGQVPQPHRGAMLAETTRRGQDGSVLGMQVGRLSEQGGPLASAGSGAFTFGRGADTLFLGLFGSYPWSARTTLFGRWGWGSTGASSFGDGLLQADSAIRTQSYALGASTRDALIAEDRLTFTLSQPLRVTAGSAALTVPTGRTMDGTVLADTCRIGLTPSGTETDWELGWTTRPGPGELTLGAGLMLAPGQVAGAGPGVEAGVKYRISW